MNRGGGRGGRGPGSTTLSYLHVTHAGASSNPYLELPAGLRINDRNKPSQMAGFDIKRLLSCEFPGNVLADSRLFDQVPAPFFCVPDMISMVMALSHDPPSFPRIVPDILR